MIFLSFEFYFIKIIIFDLLGILGESYESSGKYQTSSDLEELKKSWKPSSMLPKMYLDKDIKNSK